MAEGKHSSKSESLLDGNTSRRYLPNLILPTSRPESVRMPERSSSSWTSHKNAGSRYPPNLILPTSQSQFLRKRRRHEGDHRPVVRDDLDLGGFKNSRFKFSSNFSIASDSSSSSRRENYLNTENRLKKAHSRNSISSDSSEIFSINPNKADVADFVPQKRERHFGYRYLDELSQKESYDVVVEITKVNCPFDTYLEKSEMDPDWLFLLMKVIRMVCQSDFKSNRCEILGKLCNSQILTIVWNYLGDVALESKESRVQNLPNFINDLSELYKCLINTMPSVAMEKDLRQTILKTKMAIENLNRHQKSIQIDEAVDKQLDMLLATYDDHLKVVQERLPKEKTRSYLDRIADCAPPENFRELSFYPTYEDIARKNLGFVRPNKVDGAYDSVEHYLDIQFRLLREDFIDPLRKGLHKYTLSKSETTKAFKFKYDNVRLYPDTRFVQVKNSKSHHLGILLNFDPNGKMKKMKWDRSKRFMYGSLLMFTADDFHTFFFGTVLERNLNDLSRGMILVALTENARVCESFFKHPFLMAESEVFFNPYFLAMKLLKELDDSSFPMKKYIVEGKSTTEYPSYLTKFNSWSLDGRIVNPTDVEKWPSAIELGLDSFQHRAFVAALTQDFCVIQGPPGTGKTFLGLKIVKTILRNAKPLDQPKVEPSENDLENTNSWEISQETAVEPVRTPEETQLIRIHRAQLYEDIRLQTTLKLPILIVCYTNHALDQFLEGMLEFTQDLIRVGGQSRSEILQKYNLRGRESLWHAQRSSVSRSIAAARDEIKGIREEIDFIGNARKSSETPIGILSVQIMKNVIPKRFQFLTEKDEELQTWLLDENHYESRSFMNQDFHNFDFGSTAMQESQEFFENEVDQAIEDTNIVDEDDLFDPQHFKQHNFASNYSVTVERLGYVCQGLIDEYQSLRGTPEFYQTEHPLRQDIERRIRQFYILKENLQNSTIRNSQEADWLFHKNPARLPVKSRWTLYWSWVVALQEHLANRLEELERRYRNKMNQYEEFKQLEDLNIVRNADIIGMTTTGAATMNLLLKSLKPAVVVVEEAAEVLETHVVTSLTKECQHVILIGDHQQLKPSTAVYELSKNYNINVSLFERMIKNGLNCPVLNVQHRMRPEISCLITPLIYPDLKNHDSVLKYESVRGLAKNVFFLDHKMPEQVNDDTVSKQNLHEAEFIVKFSRYLILQGYEAEKITILTTYTGQMFLIRDLQRDQFFAQHVKCIVVDKYQGEENDIILLSLVRSNADGKIGFLSIKNRVCVALSRARKGLFIVGNMDCLTKESELWKNIKEILLKNDAIGEKMQLHCSIHEKTTFVETVQDFKNVREGGCDNYCNELMQCGHQCPSLCHPTNRDHKAIRCREPCKNTCPRNLHQCKRPCYEECPKCKELVEFILPCKHVEKLSCCVQEDKYLCKKIVDDVSPLCNHPVKRKCHQKPEDAICSFPCEDRLDCGHVCTRTCHKQNDPDHAEFKCMKLCDKLNELCSKAHVCEKLCHEPCGKCSIKIDIILPCDHKWNLACSTDISTVKCRRKCGKICPQCQKRCPKYCWEDCNPCTHEVKKVVPECGHEVTIQCHMEPKREYCRQKCNSNAPCGHKCRSMCCKPCGSEKCLEIVKSSEIKPLCGHDFVYCFCYRKDEVSQMKPESFLHYCKEPCNAILECGDVCSGTCGGCWQGRLHWICQKRCGNILICGHSCKAPCSRLCPPCDEPCTFRCLHSYCPKKCGVPCVPCKEPCEWKCKHMRCTRKCGEICNRKPCNKPCKLKIPACGHACIGFCGEPCPPLCRICNPEITDIIFGYEDEPDARFVLLVDCNHTIESKALDQHLSTAPEGDEIVMKICPLCKTPITKTLRYMNYVKQTYKHIINVKQKIFGNCDNITTEIKHLTKSFQELSWLDLSFFRDVPQLMQFIQNCYWKLAKSSKMYPLSQHQVSTINFYHKVLDSIISRRSDFRKVKIAPDFGPVLPEPNPYLIGGRNFYPRFNRGSPERSVPLSHSRRQNTREVVMILKMAEKERVCDFLRNFISRLEKTNWRINRQRILDFLDELQRYHAMINYCKLCSNPSYKLNKGKEEISALSIKIENNIFNYTKFTSDVKAEVEDLLKKFQIELKSTETLMLDEKRMINAAMSKSFGSQSAGHWYTCPRGHYYCITECGMARQAAKCPECNETIGEGSNYRQRRATNFA